MSFKKYITIVVVVLPLLLAMPPSAQAVDWFPVVPCGLNEQPKNATRMDTLPDGTQIPHDYTQPCNQCLLIEVGKNAIDFTLYGMVPVFGTLLFIWAGFLILWGGKNGEANAIANGQKLMWDTAIGIAIILSSWMITNFILKSLAVDEVAGTPWYEVRCKTGTLEDIVLGAAPRSGQPGTTNTVPNQPGTPGSPSQPGSPTVPGGGTTACTTSSSNLCQAQSTACSNSSCAQYSAVASKYAGGAATANLLKAVMMKESSCNSQSIGPAPSSGNERSYGLMMLLPSTANMYKSRCGVTENIDGAWLQAHPEQSVCIAAEYIRSLSQGVCGSSVRNLAAGYNGGSGACSPSVDCTGVQSCSNEPVRRWECLYDDPQQKTCNTRYNETRNYAPKVLYCNNNPGF